MTTTDFADQPFSAPNGAPGSHPTESGPTESGSTESGPTHAEPTMSSPSDSRPSVSPHSFRLVRSRQERRIFGVCGGIARQLDIDVTLVRVAFVVAAFIGFGIPLYLAAAILAPVDDLVG